MFMARTGKRVNPIIFFALMIAAAAMIVGAVVFVIYRSGLRYIKYNTEEHGVIKFVGRVDPNNDPLSGKIYFGDGSTADLEKADELVLRDGTRVNGTLYSVVYSNGDAYIGQLDHFIRNGKGSLSYSGGDVYEGEFSYGEINGEGHYYYVDGDVYTGSFADGRKNGAGSYVWAADQNGRSDSYVGEFRDDRRTGKGTYTYSNGNVYEGDFINDVKEGKGKLTFASGDVYEGDFLADMRTGSGSYTWASGESYTGQFLKNTITGYGTYYWIVGENRRSYEGYFDNGKIVYIEEGAPDGDGQTP